MQLMILYDSDSQFGFNGTFQKDLGGTLLLFLRVQALQAELNEGQGQQSLLKGHYQYAH